MKKKLFVIVFGICLFQNFSSFSQSVTVKNKPELPTGPVVILTKEQAQRNAEELKLYDLAKVELRNNQARIVELQKIISSLNEKILNARQEGANDSGIILALEQKKAIAESELALEREKNRKLRKTNRILIGVGSIYILYRIAEKVIPLLL